jgi:hypothetical protein
MKPEAGPTFGGVFLLAPFSGGKVVFKSIRLFHTSSFCLTRFSSFEFVEVLPKYTEERYKLALNRIVSAEL